MSTTAAAVTVPALIRGRLIKDELVSFGARGGSANFAAPDPQAIGARLVQRNPGALKDLQELPFAEIVAFLAAVGERLRLDDNPYLQQALAQSAPFSDMT